jgi:hypothetical protein
VERRLDTRPPGAELTDLGREQARNFARSQRDSPGLLLHSTARRAAQTAHEISAECAVFPSEVDAIYEVQAGHLENRSDDDAIAEFNGVYQRWLEGELDVSMPGGECGHDVLDRYLPVLTGLRLRYLDDDDWTGDIVVVDIGGPVEPGYNSDCTRTYSIGEPTPEIAEQYVVLQRAQAAAVAAVRPGITAEQVDAAARDLLADAGLGEYFVHRTGHGIGLSVHEEPYIVAGNDQRLAEGMAFSVEPGIYLPGRWGARIEDIVIVTADGAQSVNTRPHDLIVVD